MSARTMNSYSSSSYFFWVGFCQQMTRRKCRNCPFNTLSPTTPILIRMAEQPERLKIDYATIYFHFTRRSISFRSTIQPFRTAIARLHHHLPFRQFQFNDCTHFNRCLSQHQCNYFLCFRKMPVPTTVFGGGVKTQTFSK